MPPNLVVNLSSHQEQRKSNTTDYARGQGSWEQKDNYTNNGYNNSKHNYASNGYNSTHTDRGGDSGNGVGVDCELVLYSLSAGKLRSGQCTGDNHESGYRTENNVQEEAQSPL